MSMEEKYILEMTPETAILVTRACEFYARAMWGQLGIIADDIANNIPWERMPPKDSKEYGEAFENWLTKRANAEEAMNEAKLSLFTELAENASYGVGHNRDSDIVWQAYEVLRYARAWHDHPEGGITVDFNKPMKWTDEPLPKCRVEEKG